MGYSLVIGTVSHEEAWSEVMPDIVQSFVKNMVSCLGGREEGGEETATCFNCLWPVHGWNGVLLYEGRSQG